MKKKWIPLAILGGVAFVAVGGEVVRQLWNWLLPPLFGLREITFWQALGILTLSRILFGGFGCGSGGPHRPRRADLTAEERERVREGLRGAGGMGPAASE